LWSSRDPSRRPRASGSTRDASSRRRRTLRAAPDGGAAALRAGSAPHGRSLITGRWDRAGFVPPWLRRRRRDVGRGCALRPGRHGRWHRDPGRSTRVPAPGPDARPRADSSAGRESDPPARQRAPRVLGRVAQRRARHRGRVPVQERPRAPEAHARIAHPATHRLLRITRRGHRGSPRPPVARPGGACQRWPSRNTQPPRSSPGTASGDPTRDPPSGARRTRRPAQARGHD
jgi:hypothetical protein